MALSDSGLCFLSPDYSIGSLYECGSLCLVTRDPDHCAVADFSIWRDSSLNCRHVISPSVYHGCTTEPGETLLVPEKLWEFKERMLKSKDIFY